jgi:hypothetical protein
MSNVKVSHRWWQRRIFSDHDEDGRVLPSDSSLGDGYFARTIDRPIPPAPYNPPEYDGMNFQFLFWSGSGTLGRDLPATASGGWATKEDDYFVQPGLTPPREPWHVYFPDGDAVGTVTAWYALIEDYPAAGVHVDAFSLEDGTFLDWQADPDHPVFTSDDGWWGSEGMVETSFPAGGVRIAAPDTWPPPNALLPGPELEFNRWLS